MNKISAIRGRLAVKQIYTCAKCKKQLNGATQHIDFNEIAPDGNGIDTIVYILGTLEKRSAYMPFGWSFNGNFNCENCKSKH